MPKFSQQNVGDDHLYAEETDAPLPEKLNPNTRYAFFSHIAKGGKSLIKSCRDLHLRRTVCYKTLRPEFIDDPVETQRLLREARISAMLQHPNTVPTYELGRDNRGNYYFTMKLVHGYTLREVMDYRDRYDLSQLMDLIVQVTRALGYAHTRGVVHRDIKPENILVGPYGEVLVMDWGLAKVWRKDATIEAEESIIDEADAGKGKLQGTVMYMSPEQIDRAPDIDGRSDLYSLGSLLYELLCGVTPFQGEVVHRLLNQIRFDIPPDPRTVSKIPIPDVLAELAMSCLQKDPKNRPATADDILRVLRQGWG